MDRPGTDPTGAASIERRRVLRASAGSALGISTMALPTAAQAFSLTSAGAAVDGVTVYWSDGGFFTADGRIGRLTYRGLDAGVDTIENDWVTGLWDPRCILADAGYIYFSVPYAQGNASEQGLFRINIASKTRETIVAGANVIGFDIDGSEVYYTISGTGLYRIAKDGSGSSTQVAADPQQTLDVKILGDDVLVSQPNVNRISSVPKSGGSMTEFATVASPWAIGIGAGSVFVSASGNSTVTRLNTDGSAAGQFTAAGSVRAMQVLDTTVFAATRGSNALSAAGPDGANRDVFATTSDSPATLVSSQVNSIAVVV